MSSLQGYVDRRVLMLLQDGRVIVVCSLLALVSFISLTEIKGVMAGFDQKSNVVLSDSKERIYSMEEGVEEVPLGLYLVKGDMMCAKPFDFTDLCVPNARSSCSVLIGELDEAVDQAVDLGTIRAEPIPPIRY
ncbi:U6 snRNA-associated Sm-like protein LSm8 [Mycena indigotica]|uniref:LSM2-LSM8 complex subunit LSM8 n=1 Tax=Mycena indigotica TaxID=2126181 RepID=A0A8H6TF48_9AGAR|nr:U6 snRNA-associated Sm-like protein LSm8 [Mycena indigotica]KAF7316221.1 U6 snRNA-associated Sm-like protein LSm8 [Mycena indigotica]